MRPDLYRQLSDAMARRGYRLLQDGTWWRVPDECVDLLPQLREFYDCPLLGVDLVRADWAFTEAEMTDAKARIDRGLGVTE